MSLSPINATTTAASPVDGLGTILEYSTDSGTTWKQVANLLDIKPHASSVGKIKTSTHSTTGDNTYRPMGLGEPGETEYSLLYDKTAYGALMTLKTAKTVAQWRVTYKDAATDVTNGFLSECKVVTPMEGDASIECKVTHSGSSTLVTT